MRLTVQLSNISLDLIGQIDRRSVARLRAYKGAVIEWHVKELGELLSVSRTVRIASLSGEFAGRRGQTSD